MSQEYDPEKAFALNFIYLRVDGLWVAGMKNPILRFYAFGVLAVFAVLYFAFEVAFVAAIWGDVQAMVDCSFLLFTRIGQSVKLVNFLFRQKHLERMFLQLKEPMFIPKRPKHFTVMKTAMTGVRRDTMIFYVFTVSTILCWAMLPLINKSEVKELPLMGWFPFNVTVSPAYEFAYIYQVTSVLLNACVNVMVDTLTSGLLILMGAQIDMPKDNLLSLANDISKMTQAEIAYVNSIKMYRSKLMFAISNKTVGMAESSPKYELNDASETVNVANVCEATGYEDILHARIPANIEHFTALVKFTNDVRGIFQIGIMSQFLVSSVIICLTCYELSLVSPNSMEFASMLQYMVCMLFQIFCYCWHGNEIIEKSPANSYLLRTKVTGYQVQRNISNRFK
ncbi:odorant receptor coreceptor-like [Cephus cinctus]|uniref:Odorant receptor n=1 Tax=Cephus cinctus TaxID=211228 RepID=A0AAJ7RDT9_CEPCN|nr:odorant receptor coreceptor-like [Cephus cinctus]